MSSTDGEALVLDTTHVRTLAAGDIPELRALLDRDPTVNLFVRNRLDATELQPRWLGGEMWGYFEHGRLVSACHAGANVVPVEATPAAVEAFARQLVRERLRPSSIVGLRDSVLPLWELLAPAWGPARSPRLDQPFMVLDHDSDVVPDARVRRVVIDEIGVLYPACVAMFLEEVGVDPEQGSRGGYRARVHQLVSLGWSFAIVEDGEVVFKTEVGAATPEVCQLQGVWVHPDHRGRGIAAGALAAVVQQVRQTVAPVVTLYVNDHNVPARRTYERVGFEQTETFASILL